MKMLRRYLVSVAGRHRGISAVLWALTFASATFDSCASEGVAAEKANPPAALAAAIVDRWQAVAIAAGAHHEAWRDVFLTHLQAMDGDTLEGVDSITTDAVDARAAYDQFAQAVRNATFKSYMLSKAAKEPNKLASATTEQTFVPIVPCRIVDTRNAGGAIAAGTTRNFRFYAASGAENWGAQGGIAGLVSSTCPATIQPNGASSPTAAVVTVTVVTPSAAGNWIIWGGANPIPTISALNWNGPGEFKANTTVIPGGSRSGTGSGGAILDFAVRYNGSTGAAHLVADLVGYFVENRATVLDCYESGITSTSVAAHGVGALLSTGCSSGWTLAGGNCDSDNHRRVKLLGKYGNPAQAWYCAYANDDSSARSIYASAICCRIPGR